MAQVKRNGYVDVMKLIFAFMIADFHFGTGFLPGGYLAVEAFFMVSGFFMMKSMERISQSEPVGTTTVKFMYRKYKGLLPVLFVSMVIGFVAYAIIYNQTVGYTLKQIPLLIFEIFPLQTAGFIGVYVVGISWYLSSMFLAMAIIFPFLHKARSNFSLTVCPLIVLLGYGIIAARYGCIGGVGKGFLAYSVIQEGVLRALAGCSLGCLIYEINKRIKDKKFTSFAKTVFTVAEAVAFIGIVCLMHYQPYSKYDFVVTFLFFGMLIIGISGISHTACLWSPKWTKHFGNISTLIVLNHYCWYDLLRVKLYHLAKWERFFIYVGATAATCVVVHFLSKLLSIGMSKLLKKERWIKQEEK